MPHSALFKYGLPKPPLAYTPADTTAVLSRQQGELPQWCIQLEAETFDKCADRRWTAAGAAALRPGSQTWTLRTYPAL